ncbi:conserved repeat domain-containing protein [Amycolatopsis sacchari]|uniref:Conserved repeat domain-containing protein n=1 Tax=Amycolatopsis sacchari TaxID=115433 RepID=A0A1I3LWL4_9PSEU|nr:conserved repeat domain-containing protein [Amycolatopsis sacchari]
MRSRIVVCLLGAVVTVVSACTAEEGHGVDLSSAEAGWGPGRPTYPEAGRPAGAVLNSVIDNPRHGDERSFVTVRPAGDPAVAERGLVQLKPRTEYEAWIYFRNDARSADATSRNTRVAVTLPAGVMGRERLNATITSANASPPRVWKGVVLATSPDDAVAVRIVPGSAWLYRDDSATGTAVPVDELFSMQGTPVGCGQPDGLLPGGDGCAGFVTFRFFTDQPNFTVDQWVAPAGSKSWSASTTAAHGDAVDFKIRYRNTGTTEQNDVVVRSELPAGLTYVPGSTKISASSTGNEWKPIESDDLATKGINVGSYSPDGGVYLMFTATVDAEAARLPCETSSLTGTVAVDTKNGTKRSTSTVEVARRC